MQSPKMNHILKEAYRIGKRDVLKPQRRKPGAPKPTRRPSRFVVTILIMALALLARGTA